ncbi:MAG TPA: tetratricopeptide repeat protein, partial [Anaerolineae bacterium]|nr:tetratricopeptide repeat protein [Anaerolineae bacterium]
RDKMAEDGNWAQLYIDWSYVAFNLKEMGQAESYARQGRQVSDTPQAEAQCHNILGILARHKGDFEPAITHFSQSARLAEEHDLPDTRIAALNNLALAETAVDQTQSAQEHLQTALTLCQTYGDRHREAALHNNLADLYHQSGAEEAAMAELKTAVAIYAEIGGQPGNWQPEIWKLTEW